MALHSTDYRLQTTLPTYLQLQSVRKFKLIDITTKTPKDWSLNTLYHDEPKSIIHSKKIFSEHFMVSATKTKKSLKFQLVYVTE